MASYMRDDNYFPLLDKDGLIISKAVTYVVGTTGATGAHTLFTISGPCVVKVVGVVNSSLTSDGAATLEVGIAGATAALCAQTAYTNLTIGKFYVDATPAIDEAEPTGTLVALDIIATVGTFAVKGGAITFYCYWRPLSPTSTCVAA